MDLLSENCLWFIAFSDGFVFLSAALVLAWHGKPLLTILNFFFLYSYFKHAVFKTSAVKYIQS